LSTRTPPFRRRVGRERWRRAPHRLDPGLTDRPRTVVVTGGTSGIGRAAVARFAARGADVALLYDSGRFADAICDATAGQGVDVVFDAIGPSSFRRSYRSLRQGGRLIMFGLAEAQTGDKRDIPALLKGLVRMPMATMPWWKSLSMMNENKGIFGLNMLSWWDREGLDRLVAPMGEMLASGKFDPLVAESFPFDRAADAHRYIAEARNIGKVVLVP
jgi:NADPH:quinone reductase-like Zn-dependent oxidoreductase